MDKKKNNSISCTVENCKYHCPTENFCSKTAIKVGGCKCEPKTVDSTCCQSFEAKTY